MRIHKHLKLLLFFVDIRYVHFIAFYDRNNFKTNKQPQVNNYLRGWSTQVTASSIYFGKGSYILVQINIFIFL